MDPGVKEQPDGSFCPAALSNARYTRSDGKLDDKDGDTRTPTERDKARIHYSLYTQRLAGVTQIVTPDEHVGDLHNRQSHSTKVALLSGEIAKDLIRRSQNEPKLRDRILAFGGIDIAACEAAGFGHDLGHPPFGHVAEKLLDAYIRGKVPFRPIPGDVTATLDAVPKLLGPTDRAIPLDGFEGNAQSFRIVTKLDSNKRTRIGLNLTAVTLAAILKYPWWRVTTEKKFDRKFGTYSSELSEFGFAREWTLDTGVSRYGQTVEAAIMDTADDLTYAIHDLQDFYVAGRLDLNRIDEGIAAQVELMHEGDYVDFSETHPDEWDIAKASEHRESSPVGFLEASYRTLNEVYLGFVKRDSYIQALENTRTSLQTLKQKFERSRNEIGRTIKAFSQLLGAFAPAIDVAEPGNPPWPEGPPIYLRNDEWHHVQVLKQISKRHIIRTPFIGIVQQAQRAALVRTLHTFDDWLRDGPRYEELPEFLGSTLNAASSSSDKVQYDDLVSRRAVVDYLCSLTDRQVMELSHHFAGLSLPRTLLT